MKFSALATIGALALLANSADALTIKNKLKAKEEDAADETLTQADDQTTMTEAAAPEGEAAVATGAEEGTSSKVGIDVLEKGQGDTCQTGQTATVHYTGALASNGNVFDSSLEKGKPIKFQIGDMNVIQCWEQAIVQLHVGDKADLGCPASLSYGATEKPGIPANSELYFNVEVVNCE
uniref:peptidylprolyl isomerase n=1 Tax=Strombidium inclinatum TaxID=197538 RepID=A0A7S3IWM5_9SPIT|mmetsp:Transcript_42287/g.64832  ORF Transcript_42287/g.64832 Transcript_42287/m.64832 type:complete len:178 (+) Transcript_42287:42-575(+)